MFSSDFNLAELVASDTLYILHTPIYTAHPYIYCAPLYILRTRIYTAHPYIYCAPVYILHTPVTPIYTAHPYIYCATLYIYYAPVLPTGRMGTRQLSRGASSWRHPYINTVHIGGNNFKKWHLNLIGFF